MRLEYEIAELLESQNATRYKSTYAMILLESIVPILHVPPYQVDGEVGWKKYHW
jgi:hypothetical protein